MLKNKLILLVIANNISYIFVVPIILGKPCLGFNGK